MMSFENNDCPKCTKDRMCPKCHLGMLEFEVESAKRRIVETQKVIGNYDSAIEFWDNEAVYALNQVERFKALKKKEQENAR